MAEPVMRRERRPIIPSRIELPMMAFPVPEANRLVTHSGEFYTRGKEGNFVRAGYRRGSFGTLSWRSRTPHLAIDIFAPVGYGVVSPVDGEIVAIERTRDGGNVVRIRGGDGTHYLFTHMHETNPSLSVGSRVSRMERIGSVGRTGNTRTPHLHFALYRIVNGRKRYYNPIGHFD